MTTAFLLFNLAIFHVVFHVVVSADWPRRQVLIACLGVVTTTAAAPWPPHVHMPATATSMPTCAGAADGIDQDEELHPPASKKPKPNHLSGESMRSDRDRWGASVSASASAAVTSGCAAPDSDCTSTMVGLAVDRDEAAIDETTMQGHPDFIRSVMVHM